MPSTNCGFRGVRWYQISNSCGANNAGLHATIFPKSNRNSCSKVKTPSGRCDTRRPPPNAVISYPGRSLYRTGHRASPIYYLLSVNDRRFVTLPPARRCPTRPRHHKSSYCDLTAFRGLLVGIWTTSVRLRTSSR